MCGICGVFNYRTSEPVEEQVLNAMNQCIVHRGPDDDGYHLEGPLGIAMRRLSIIDLDGGHQPMSNEDDSIWIVFNGEIYNFPDLRRELESYGHTFKTNSDTETIIHAYEQWGMDALSRLNGMYGFALWDSRNRELILARDPFGIKPLYYTDQQGQVLFGSEIKTILAHPGVQPEVDPHTLDIYLSLTFVPSPDTIFKGIHKLPPGYALRITSDGTELTRFYTRQPDLSFNSPAQWLDALQAEIEASIKRQMIADVPVGVMLSGGVDSATVATLMTQFSDQPVHSFTVGFEGDFDQNELKAARRSAEIIGLEHHNVALSVSDAIAFLPISLWHLEEPVATASTFAFYSVCKLAREHVKVVLTGQGADEPFAGYPRHLGEHYSRYYRMIPRFIRNGVLAPLAQMMPRNEQAKRVVYSLGTQDPAQRFGRVYTIFNDDLKDALYHHDSRVNGNGYALSSAVERWQKDVTDRDGLNQMLYVDARFSLPDNLLMYGDKMSMAASLEARVPFLDLKLMQLVESMPAEMKIRGRQQKHLLKKAVTKWVPSEIIDRKKIGFATPVDQWFGRELKGYLSDRLLAEGSGCDTYFDRSTIETMINDHASGRYDYKRHLFSLLTFELWHEQFIQKKLVG